jgi:2-amino-4-hydroxy-6-hydroxymethyldihydropteridine diphosphokinase
MTHCRVYLGLGGNLADPAWTIRSAAAKLSEHPDIRDLRLSRLFRTKPVSAIPQPPFLNAVCSFLTSLPLERLWDLIQKIEKDLGKIPKGKEEPRKIDIDILFYGIHRYNQYGLQIPHPLWRQRLFVLKPLRDLTRTIFLEDEEIDLDEVIKRENCK